MGILRLVAIIKKWVFHRVFVVALLMVLQLLVWAGIIWRFSNYFVFYYAFCILLSIAVATHIINSKQNPAYKMAWVIPILLIPLFGGPFYLLCGRGRNSRREQKRARAIVDNMPQYDIPNAIHDEISAQDKLAGNQSQYLIHYSHCPPYKNTHTEYYELGEVMFERMKEELEKAERYIFMEYFIIEPGIMWDSILDILRRKAAAGVDVRLVYDDFGCMFTLPNRYDRTLEDMGIKCSIFNRFKPVLSLQFNNRNHRKILVIDGHTAFTGGVNLADEYINAFEKHGHWKDTGILLKGEGAWSFVEMFLSLWGYLRAAPEQTEDYRPINPPTYEHALGYVQPYWDAPMDDEQVGLTVYMNLINKAKHHVYVMTPYLIIDNETLTAFGQAAKSGVDVQILTPGVPDKWYVHAVTRAYYQQLIEDGVRIFEYTPGFLHAKSFLVDDEYAVVGTVNLDYRSLYLHFECGAWTYRSEVSEPLKADFVNTRELCREITLEDCRKVPFPVRLGRGLL